MSTKLSQQELWAYSRQIVLDKIGYNGQVHLKKGRVLVAGVGGLGTPIAFQLAAMGVGYLRIVDRDIVSISDLHRQYLYDASSIGMPKVEVAASKLSTLNPQITIEPIPISIKQWNVNDLLKDIDVVIDGLDNIEARYLINHACVRNGIPYVYGGAIKTQGNVSTIIPNKTPCLECFNPNLTDEILPKCSVIGVYTPVLGIIASIEVSETIQLLTRRNPKLKGKLLFIDLDDLSFEEINIIKYEKCPVCSDKTDKLPTQSQENLVEKECSRDGRTTIIVTPKKWLTIDLISAYTHLKNIGYSLEKQGKLGISLSNKHDLTISLLQSGVTIFQTPSTKDLATIYLDIATLYKELLTEILQITEDALPLDIQEITKEIF
jgi:adenylyltransferase/sulfurtransferase